MTAAQSAEDRAAAFRETYELAICVLLPPKCELRIELATVMAWAAATGCNISAMARGMKRNRRWVGARLDEARMLVRALRDDQLDDYLGS